MYFKLGVYRILERDIKYIRWFSNGKQMPEVSSAVVCFRDGEEITIERVPIEDRKKIEEWWDKDIERTMYPFGCRPNYKTVVKEEEK